MQSLKLASVPISTSIHVPLNTSANRHSKEHLDDSSINRAPALLPSGISSSYKWVTIIGILLGAGGCSNDENLEKASMQNSHTLVQNNSETSPGEDEKNELNRQLKELENELYSINLLDLHNKLYDLYNRAYKVGMAVRPQELLGQRLSAEVLPVLYNKVLLEKPDEVIVAEFTEPGVFDQSGDFGRGLRVILRKKIGEFNISTIMFLDYNEKTKKIEFLHDIFFKERSTLVPDAMRMLIEYNVKPSKETLRSKSYRADYSTEAGFIGTTISAELEPGVGKVTDLQIYPAKDNFDESPIGIDNKPFPGNPSFWGCAGCHSSGAGFSGGPFISFYEKQTTIHLHQNEAIERFLKHVGENKHFNSPEERTETLAKLRTQLTNPKDNLEEILPTGLLDVLLKKQKERTQASAILELYNKEEK